MMGSGKSAVGDALARRMGTYSFLDTDAILERATGTTVRRMFEAEGEDAFRDAEAIVLDSVHARARCVVGTQRGRAVYFTVPLRTLALVLALGNTARAPTELGIPPFQAVPVVHATVPDVGSHVDWACTTAADCQAASSASTPQPCRSVNTDRHESDMMSPFSRIRNDACNRDPQRIDRHPKCRRTATPDRPLE
jgi:hypothetical protein